MKWTALLLLSVALPACCCGSSATPNGYGELGRANNGGIGNTKQGHYLIQDSEICIFRGMPIDCSRFLRLPCIFNMGPALFPVPQGGRGPRSKRQITGATAISSTTGFAYPFGLFGRYPYGGGYGSYWDN